MAESNDTIGFNGGWQNPSFDFIKLQLHPTFKHKTTFSVKNDRKGGFFVRKNGVCHMMKIRIIVRTEYRELAYLRINHKVIKLERMVLCQAFRSP